MVESCLLDRLAGHHRSLQDIIDRARPLLAENRPPMPLEIGRLRWEMVRAFTAYTQFQHREIFEPIAQRGPPHIVQMASALKADCAAAGNVFTDYVRDWSGRGTGDNWNAYRPAALAMIDQMERHLRREQQNVCSLLRAARVMMPPSRSQR